MGQERHSSDPFVPPSETDVVAGHAFGLESPEIVAGSLAFVSNYIDATWLQQRAGQELQAYVDTHCSMEERQAFDRARSSFDRKLDFGTIYRSFAGAAALGLDGRQDVVARVQNDPQQYVLDNWQAMASVGTSIVGDERTGTLPTAAEVQTWLDESLEDRWFDDRLDAADLGIESVLPLTGLLVRALDDADPYALKDLSRYTRSRLDRIYSLMNIVDVDLPSFNVNTPFTTYSDSLAWQIRTSSRDRVYAAQKLLVLADAFYVAAKYADELTASSRKRRELKDAIETIGRYELARRQDSGIGDNESTETMPTDIATDLLPMEVNWRVLPEGEGALRRATEDILTSQRYRGREVEVDPQRLLVLSKIRERWGCDNAYYAKCSLASKAVVDRQGKEAPDEYILLILQERDAAGRVTAEHAVAESPITEKNATYVFRQDIDDLSWRDVMALDKKTARSFHARAVKHTRIGGEWTPDSTTEKVMTLLSADPDYFIRGEFMGIFGLRLRREVGETALRGALVAAEV